MERRVMGKTPIQALCALPEAKRIAILFDGQVCVLDMRSLGAMERLSGTKGASALAREVSAQSVYTNSTYFFAEIVVYVFIETMVFEEDIMLDDFRH
jgi:hypothetical protein